VRPVTAERTILSMGGGGFTMEPGDPALDELVLDLAGAREPKVLFLATASGDSAQQLSAFRAAFGGRACDAAYLSLFRLHGTTRPLREVVLAQDVVYVGGGSMKNMLAIWKAHGLDVILREAWERGIVLAGLSAGAMCWFEGGVTMSGGPAETILGLGFLPGSLSVHTDGEPARLPVYLEAVREGALPGGWALDDGAAIVWRGEEAERIVAARPGARALKVDCVAGELVRRQVEPELIDRPRASHVSPDIQELRDVRELRTPRANRL
jgi:dipeptidase E